MKKYHIFEALFLSFYSKSLYQDVAKQWKGLALGYFLLVIAICWLPFSYDFHRLLNHFSAQMLPGIVAQVPTITLEKGKLSIDRPVPYLIKEPGDDMPMVLFDTSGNKVSMDGVNAYVLVTQNKVMVRDNTSPVPKVTSYSLSKLDDMHLKPSQFSEFAKKVIFYSSVLMYPLSALISFAFRLLQALVFGGLAMMIASLFRTKLAYQQGVRIAVVALTPMLFISTLADYFNLPYWHSYGWFFEISLSIGYLIYAVNAQRSTADTEKPAFGSD
jgi:hypothetical protein